MKRFFRKVHLWLSVPFGLIITITCFTGAALVFEQEIMEQIHPKRYFVGAVGTKTLPIDQLALSVARTLPDSVEVKNITASVDPQRTWQVSLSKPRRASVYINPYTGKITGRSERTAFFTCMFKMHRWLLDSAKPGEIFWGKLIVGISTLLFVFVLLTGVVVWFPRSCKSLKKRLKISVSKGWKRFWFDLHVSAGIYATILLLIMALTGLTWSFPWYRSGFYHLLGVETSAPSHGKQESGKNRKGKKTEHSNRSEHKLEDQQGRFDHWNNLYEQLSTAHPNHTRISISNGMATVTTNHFGNQRASDSYTFDPHTGQITEAVSYANSESASKLRGWIYSLHVGNWGGVPSRILTVLASLIGASLPLTGYYLWLKRLRRKKQH